MGPWQGELPVDAAFVAAPLPDAGPPLATFREQSRILVGKGYLYDVALLPENLVATSSDDEATLRVYDRGTKQLVGNFPVPGFSRFATGHILPWPGDEPSVLVASAAGLFRMHARSGVVEAQLSDKPFHTIRHAPGQRVLVATSKKTAAQRSTLSFFEHVGSAELRPLGTLTFDERVDSFDLTRDHRLLAVTQYPSNTLRVLDLAKGGQELFRMPTPRYAGDCAFSPDGRFVAVGGEGVLVVDLINPTRRAFFGHVLNNVGHIRFTPRGDALLASSFDGRIRAFSLETAADGSLRLALATELVHTAGANVYGFALTPDASTLISVSGDRHLRTFAGQRAPGVTAPAHFRTLDQWAAIEPALSRPRALVDLGSVKDGRYILPSLSKAPRPSRIRSGRYDCKISRMYKLRGCTVERDAAGHTILTFESDNLLSLRGVVYDDGPVVRFEAALVDKSNVVDCDGCERQPLLGVFRGDRGHYEGLLTFRTLFDPYTLPEAPRPDVPLEEASDRFYMQLRARGSTAEPTTQAPVSSPLTAPQRPRPRD